MRATRSLRLLLGPAALLLGLHAGAQSPAEAPEPGAAQAAASDTAGTEEAGVDPASATPRPVSRPDIAMLQDALSTQRRLLPGADGEFAVFVTTAVKVPVRGAVVLIPGDGEYPTASQQLEQLRRALPAHGWSTWLLSLEAPPLTQALLKIEEPPPATAAEAASGNAAAADPGAAGTPATQDPAKAEGSQTAEATPTADAAPQAPETEDAAEDPLLLWSRAAEARIASATAAAAADGPVALVAAGSAAALLVTRLAAAPDQVFAALLIHPRTIPGLDPDWPAELAVPVLEVLDPGDARSLAASRRERAMRARLQSYQQLRLAAQPIDAGSEQLLTRRVRSWLQRLSAPPGAD